MARRAQSNPSKRKLIGDARKSIRKRSGPLTNGKATRLIGAISWNDDPAVIETAILRESRKRDPFEHDLAIRYTYQYDVYEIGLNKVDGSTFRGSFTASSKNETWRGAATCVVSRSRGNVLIEGDWWEHGEKIRWTAELSARGSRSQ